MTSYLDKHNPSTPTQSEPLDERQVQNAAGGYVYQLDEFSALKRFLILGTEGGSLYESEYDLTQQNRENVIKAIKADGERVVDITHGVSVAGRARKNDMALFVLALCMTHGDDKTKHAVRRVFNEVVRIGTHLFMFCNFVNNMRGWGDSLMKTVAGWYTGKDTDHLAYQVTKYRKRGGWTHKDVLSMCHVGRWSPKTTNTPLYRWMIDADCQQRIIKRKRNSDEFKRYPITSETVGTVGYPRIVEGFEMAKVLGHEMRKRNSDEFKRYPITSETVGTVGFEMAKVLGQFEMAKVLGHEIKNDPGDYVKRVCGLIRDYGLTHEMIPDVFKDKPKVWEALLEKMPVTATLRNLGKLSNLEILAPFSDNEKLVLEKITPESIRKGRVHPLSILLARRVYESGEGVRGDMKWKPNNRIVSRLEDAFYWGFDSITPSGKNILLALDVSGSMFFSGDSPFRSCPRLLCGEIAAVMAMVTARVEPNHVICGFDDTFAELPITDKSSLQEAIRVVRDRNFGATDAALPMLEAYRRGWRNIDGFAIYTDNDTWIGSVHPKVALQRYRDRTGMDARLIAVSMLATDTTIADGGEPYMMDFVGMSTETPKQVSAFLNGEF